MSLGRLYRFSSWKIVQIIATVCLLVLSLSCVTDGATCPPCGNMTVPFPFSTASNCGDPLYKLVCNSSKQLEFNATSGLYPIVSINPGTQRLVIDPAPLSSTACATSDLQDGGLILNNSLPFNVTSSNTVLLLNCSDKLLYSPLDCSSKNNSCAQFLQQDSQGTPCRQRRCCEFRAGGSSTSYIIAVAPSDCTAYTSIVSLNPSVNARNWQYGVELEWIAPSEPVCNSQKDCDQFSTCSRGKNKSGLSCLCITGYHWNSSSGFCTKDFVPCNGSSCGKRLNKAALIAGLTVGLSVMLVVLVFTFLVTKRRRLAKEARDKLAKERQQILSANSGGKSAKVFTSKEMRRATQGFARDRVLGSGGFGEVYKGVLDDGTVVAVKAAKIGNIKGTEQVLNEVRILSQVNHRNLVRLLGCCVETEEPLMVYEYISNGTLLEHLNGSKGSFLGWSSRLNVALQTAEGLAYLHSAAYPPIYHRDVKSSNILLDDLFNAKVADFGLSRLAEPDLSHISTCAQGTLGYLDPEYYRNYQLTDKSDVYSFGVVLLELITSQKAIDFSRGEDDVNLAIYVLTKSEAGRTMEVVDPRLTASASESVGDTIKAVTFLALSCLQESRLERPSMKEVAEELQYIISILDTKSAEVLQKNDDEFFRSSIHPLSDDL